MLGILKRNFVLLAALAMSVSAAPEAIAQTNGEFRAFWVHDFRGMGDGRDWDESLKALKACGGNAILPIMCYGGVAAYKSEVLPELESVAERGDALEGCLAACRKHGVECHPWKVCYRMGSRGSKQFYERMKAEKRTQVDVDGKPHDTWLCPSHPENKRLEIDAMVELAGKGVDGIHFDSIRYPGSKYCFCDGCRERFESNMCSKVENWPADVRKGGGLYDKWMRFRAENITEVVSNVAMRVRKEHPGVKISAATFLDRRSSYDVGQEWYSWCEKGYLDFVCPMDYQDTAERFEHFVEIQEKMVAGVPLYPGIGLSCWKDSSNDVSRLTAQLEVVRNHKLGGFVVFKFSPRAEKAMLRIGKD